MTSEVLPQRPLRNHALPLLWVSASEVTWGDDVRTFPADTELAAWANALDGTRSIAEALAGYGGDRNAPLSLIAHGYLTGGILDAALETHRWRWGDENDRKTGNWLAANLQRQLGLPDPRRIAAVIDARAEVRIHCHGDSEIAMEVERAAHFEGIDTSARFSHSETREQVGILCSANHPDIVHDADAALIDEDIPGPRLHVAVWDLAAVVGPLVVPGLTSCLLCHHLHRRDADRNWPMRSAQWSHFTRPAPQGRHQALISNAARIAALVLTAWSDSGGQPDPRWFNRAYRIDSTDINAHVLPRPWHPLCGCAWRGLG